MKNLIIVEPTGIEINAGNFKSGLTKGVVRKSEKMKIAIIGAGIYGCHLALELNADGHSIDLYDMANDLFSGASTHNSFRIHKGYHYPRSAKTREMCKIDEKRFIKHYPHLVSAEKNNPKIFCVANDEKTLIDFNTLKIIMRGTGLPFHELRKDELNQMGFANVEGGFRVCESIFLVDKAKKWFKQNLINKGVQLKLNHYVARLKSTSQDQLTIDHQRYDYVINCTYNQSFQHHAQKHRHYFDLCFYLVVASKKPKKDCKTMSFGIFDGAYPSLEPYGYEQLPEQYRQYGDRQIFQIFHVKHTSVSQYIDIAAARAAINAGLSAYQVSELTEKILQDTRNFYPNFDNEFKVIGHGCALKTKVHDLSDTRPLMVFVDKKIHPRFIQVFSSKLTSIFSAKDLVMQLMEKAPRHMNLLAA